MTKEVCELWIGYAAAPQLGWWLPVFYKHGAPPELIDWKARYD